MCPLSLQRLRKRRKQNRREKTECDKPNNKRGQDRKASRRCGTYVTTRPDSLQQEKVTSWWCPVSHKFPRFRQGSGLVPQHHPRASPHTLIMHCPAQEAEDSDLGYSLRCQRPAPVSGNTRRCSKIVCQDSRNTSDWGGGGAKNAE